MGQKDSYEPEVVINEDKLTTLQSNIEQAKLLTQINEKKFADKLMGDNNNPIFIGIKDAYKWRGIKITGEDYDPISGTIDFELEMSRSTTKKTANEAWAAMTQEEKDDFTDKQQFIDNYKGGANYIPITSSLSKELGRRYRLWDENDVNEMLKILATKDNSYPKTLTNIEIMGNYPNMIAQTIHSKIMSDASLFSNETGMPTDKGWKQISKILPKGVIGTAPHEVWYDMASGEGLEKFIETYGNQIMALISQMRKK